MFPGAPVTAHWDLRDPAAVEGTPEAKRAAFEATLRTLARHIQHFTSLPFESVDAKALRAQVEEIGALR